LSRARGADHIVGDPKGIRRLLAVLFAIFARNQENYMKYKEMLKKRGSKNSDRISTSEKSDQASVVEEAYENPCDVLTAESEKKKYLEAWLLDSGCTHMCPKKEWLSTYKSYDGGSVIMGNNTVCKTVGIGNIRMRMFDGQIRILTNVRHVPDLKKSFLSFGALEAQGCKFLGVDRGIKAIKGSMIILKGKWTANLYKMTGNIIIGDASVTSEEDTTRLWYMRLGHMSKRGLQVLHIKGALPGIKYCKLDLCKFCIIDRQRRVNFSALQHKTKGLLDLYTRMCGDLYQ